MLISHAYLVGFKCLNRLAVYRFRNNLHKLIRMRTVVLDS